MRRTSLAIAAAMVAVAPLAFGMKAAQQVEAPGSDRTPATVVDPDDAEVRWLMPAGADDLGTGIEVRMLVEYERLPHATLGAFVLSVASGILVHAHHWQSEIIYVVAGSGVALVGDGDEEVPIRAGSTLYVPERAWHGFRNTDGENRLELLIITRPAEAGGLADFFRAAGSAPGEEPRVRSREEFVAALEQHGMEVLPQ
jgi:mannose-6-phosphate isomerase-like protein (cupin superfamily)